MMRCPVCGIAGQTCGPHTNTVPVDLLVTRKARRMIKSDQPNKPDEPEPLKRYDTETASGIPATFKYTETEAKERQEAGEELTLSDDQASPSESKSRAGVSNKARTAETKDAPSDR